ncbi:MAG: hypothetical protein QXJ44_06070 [Candidatus Nitrosocaldus sp.]
MPGKGWKAINIREEIYYRLLERYKSTTTPFVTFPAWINKYIIEKLEEDELLSKYAPGLGFIGTEQNIVYIKDHFIDKIVEVEIHDEGISKRFLYCRYCERDDCLHVGFCFAIREVNKILVERGFKQPKGEVRKETNN